MSSLLYIPTLQLTLPPRAVHAMQECARDYLIITPILGVYCLGLVLLALYLMVRMGHLRRQFSEYKNVRRVAVAIILAPVLLVTIDGATGPEHGALRRRMVVILSVFITGILFWTPVYQSVWAFIIKDEVSAIDRSALQRDSRSAGTDSPIQHVRLIYS